MSRYEMTQGQWQRLWSGAESLRHPSIDKVGSTASGHLITFANPVDNVDRVNCQLLMRQNGMALPTEAQWEYACRGGTTTPWSCTLGELPRCANLADASARRAGLAQRCESWDDGHAGRARVGSYRPNPFGLFDMHGNVAEWVADDYGAYATPARDGDGLRPRDGPARGLVRGGHFQNWSAGARSAKRLSLAVTVSMDHGLRPARALRQHP